ncbi:uncharacterized protein LOC115259151 [Aedes albopictus]|uniref:BEN domain-containing protein n=1 Tax=Aedes albopictus TaxID=7160 RepID=A0ABM1YZN2_AEDAL|nr:uncharacterized protein LOC115267701 [Aedes albopictus]
MAPEVPEDLSFGLSSVPADATVVKPDQETDSRAAVPDVPEDLRIDSPAILAQPAFAGREVSIVKLVLADDENSDAEKEALGNESMEVVPDYAVLLVLQNQVADLKQENEVLKRDNNKLRSLNMKLQEALLARPTGQNFSEIPGYPDAKWLLGISQNAQDSDYLFVKELVFRLFPQGLGNATVSGMTSNNPSGRGGNNAVEGREPVEQLDPEKVKYIRERLHERRLILQDELGVAVQRSRRTARHIAAVIANNPSLRKLPRQ